MPLNPTLKNVLIRILCIAVSPIAYYVLFRILFLVWPSLEAHNTVAGIWDFTVALTIIWLNIRKLAKPIQLITIGSYLLVFAGLMFWHKTGDMSILGLDGSGPYSQFHNYRMSRILCCLAFILLASILPIFLKSATTPKLRRFGIVWAWTSILILDFVAAMPNIYFSVSYADRLYSGYRKIGDIYKYAPMYAIESGDFQGNYFDVFIPQDSICATPEHYLKVYYERHGDLLIQPETRDTIWIEKGGVRPNADYQTIENNTSCQMRWQWQYYAWHKIKGLFCKKENER